MSDDDLPRGLRNNNPGNLVDNAFTQGMPGYIGSDGRFAQFATPHDGIMAMHQNLQSYASKGVNTPTAIANRWAPAGDGNNDPAAYAGSIASKLGVGVNDKIDLSDYNTREKLAQAMAQQENGPKATDFFGGKVTGSPTPGTAGKFGLGGVTPTSPTTPGTTSSSPSLALLQGILGKNGAASASIPFKANNSSVPTPQTKLEGMIRAAAGQGTYTPPGLAKLQGLGGALSQLFGGSTTGPGSPPGPAAQPLASAPPSASPATAAPVPAAGQASAGDGGTYPVVADMNGNPVTDMSSALPNAPDGQPATAPMPAVADAGGSGGLDLSGALASLFG